METEKKKVGRPKIIHDGRPVKIRLDKRSLEAAVRLGEGNISAGVREALRRAVIEPQVG